MQHPPEENEQLPLSPSSPHSLGQHNEPYEKSRNTFVFALGAAALVIAILVCALVVSISSHIAPAQSGPAGPISNSSNSIPASDFHVTHTFTGAGLEKTAIFTAPQDWKISYRCSGMNVNGIKSAAMLNVLIYSPDGTLQDSAVSATCAAGKTSRGATEEHQGGQIFLSIDGDAGWTVQILEPK